MKILGINISQLTKQEAIKQAQLFLSSGYGHTIFTPNPEMLVKAQADSYFSEVLNRGDINVCDGFGIKIAARLKGQSVERLTGVDFMVELCRIAEESGRSIFLLGSGSADIVQKTKINLQAQFPQLKIVGTHPGIGIAEIPALQFNNLQNERMLAEINQANPDILFVAFGMGKQEKWIVENISKLPNVHIAMGVGGSFDYISGKVPRAPRLLRKIGLEWVYRLFKQPQRIRRILNATVKFGWLVLTSIISGKQ